MNMLGDGGLLKNTAGGAGGGGGESERVHVHICYLLLYNTIYTWGDKIAKKKKGDLDENICI